VGHRDGMTAGRKTELQSKGRSARKGGRSQDGAMLDISSSPLPSAARASASPEVDAVRYDALRRRDAASDGVFWYAVLTTGVYCRPSCAARLPRPENVSFHETRESAEAAGYRPCKRCKPRDLPAPERLAAMMREVRAHIEGAEATVSLDALARRAGVSPGYLQRTFKAVVGMTPREYSAAHRLQRVQHALSQGAEVTTALYDAGYASSSRFYEQESKTLGMLPAALRKGGEGAVVHFVVRDTSLGRMMVAATARGVCSVSFGAASEERDLERSLRARFPRATLARATEGSNEHARVDALATRVAALVDGTPVPPDLPLDLLGTAFQQRVWRALREVPAGTTATYTQIAKRVGAPAAVRAVGSACGRNPVAVVVPCHRILREDGGLGGYAWGLPRKEALLARERKTP